MSESLPAMARGRWRPGTGRVVRAGRRARAESLCLPPDDAQHRRVLAVLAYLRAL